MSGTRVWGSGVKPPIRMSGSSVAIADTTFAIVWAPDSVGLSVRHAGAAHVRCWCRVGEVRPLALVLNHFASPCGQAGGTRHVELFGRLTGWDHLIVAANRNYLTGEVVRSEPGFRAVAATYFRASSRLRLVNWASYAVCAIVVGLKKSNVTLVYASSPHLFAGLAGLVLARLRGLPLVIEIRASRSYPGRDGTHPSFVTHLPTALQA